MGDMRMLVLPSRDNAERENEMPIIANLRGILSSLHYAHMSLKVFCVLLYNMCF